MTANSWWSIRGFCPDLFDHISKTELVFGWREAYGGELSKFKKEPWICWDWLVGITYSRYFFRDAKALFLKRNQWRRHGFLLNLWQAAWDKLYPEQKNVFAKGDYLISRRPNLCHREDRQCGLTRVMFGRWSCLKYSGRNEYRIPGLFPGRILYHGRKGLFQKRR